MCFLVENNYVKMYAIYDQIRIVTLFSHTFVDEKF